MTNPDPEWMDSWRLKEISSSVSAELQQQFGLERYYTPEQILAACQARHVAGDAEACAMVMFVKPESAEEVLAKYALSDPVEELRRVMAGKISASGCAGELYGDVNFFHIDQAGSYGGSCHGTDSGGDGGGGD